jgi:hypothetical protein
LNVNVRAGAAGFPAAGFLRVVFLMRRDLMKSLKRFVTADCSGWLSGTFVVVIVLIAGLSRPLNAQTPPPVQGTVALEGAMKKFYRAANVVIVTTMDGVEHAYHFAKDLVVHGGKGSGVDALEGLREGSTVVVHYTVEGTEPTAHEIDPLGSEGLEVTEGIVKRIDHGRKQVIVGYDNGRTEAFRLTDRAAAENIANDAVAGRSKVVIYYSNEAGQKVAHFFKKVPN